MFTPASRKRQFPAVKNRFSPGSPASPVGDARSSSIPDRPATGTPAPWTTRLSVLARVPTDDQSEKGAYSDQIQPVYVGEIPKIARKAFADYIQKKRYDDCFSGGMDRVTFLSWIICEDQIFIWNYLSSSPSSECIVLDFPTDFGATYYVNSNQLLVYIVKWEARCLEKDQQADSCDSAGVIICHKKTHAVIYWPDVFSETGRVPITWVPPTEQAENDQLVQHNFLNSIIASAIPGWPLESIALACQSNGELWCFHCSPNKIYMNKVSLGLEALLKGHSSINQTGRFYARSIAWRFQHVSTDTSSREFFLLTNCAIQCWSASIGPDLKVTKLWSHEIVGTDGDSGIRKDLAGQKHIWLLDMQVDDPGKEFSILVATICKDRASSSSYTQYSLLVMQYSQHANLSIEKCNSDNILERKVPLQVIIPKAKMEDESFLFSMRLLIGGKPYGSAVILSRDGTATVANYWRGATQLYKFDLPHDAGKVLDASILPSSEYSEGSWVVLTEKAGIWAIPEKAVLLGGVEPPERSLSRRGSSNGFLEDGKRNREVGGIISPRRSSSEAWNADKEGASLARVLKQNAKDEEGEVLLGHLYQDFLLSGKAEGSLQKLIQSGAFEKEGETNVFTRTSKSIVDTLAKHWTATRGAEFVTSAVTVSQLLDKQQKHERFLQFLALSKCHEELSSRQGQSLQIIVEHGEKLFGMIQLRELQNLLSQNQPSRNGSPSSFSFNDASGSLWELIQLVGEKARRNNVLLMDRDNAEVFYSRVSDLEDLFYCLSHHLSSIVGESQQLLVQIHRAHEISNACVTLVQAARGYRNEHRNWYPPPEGLIPWNCQPVVRSGLWSIASIMMELLKEASSIVFSVKSGLYSQLEVLTDVILESYIGTITAKGELGEDFKGLLEEYHKRRDILLDSLYQEVIGFANIHYQESLADGEDAKLKASTFREVLQPVLSIAKRYEAYKTLWDICYELQDIELLRSLMRESVGPKGGFSNFVFRKLYEKRQFSKLLRLGEEFQDELAMYLKQYPNLLWLHEVFLHKFSSASDTLHDLSISHDKESSYEIDEEGYEHIAQQVLSLADRRRLLNLSKISAMAGREAGFVQKMHRIEADLQILNLQEVIIADQANGKLLSPFELIRICLEAKTRELSLLAIHVFAWISSQLRSSNRRLLEECWRNAADQDDWEALHRQSLAEGWSDEVCIQFLQKTVLFEASDRCYGPDAQTFEGKFDDVLPLRKEDADHSKMKGSNSSVESILMQHKDFPDAGKLMMAAVVLGKMGVDVEADAAMELQ